MPRERPDDLPLHPVTIRWAAAYARADEGERDAVVGEILTELNALLHRAGPPGPRGAPPASDPA